MNKLAQLIKKKKEIVGFSILLMILLGFLVAKYVGLFKNYGNQGKNTSGDEKLVEVWNDISYMGNQVVTDNPWNMTVGRFEMEGEGSCMLLTPDTSVQIDDEEGQYKEIEFAYQIHPWVKAFSSGAGLEILVLDGNENVLHMEEVSIEVDDEWKMYKLDLSQILEAKHINILCNSGVNGDGNGDWIVIKLVSVNGVSILQELSPEEYIKSATYFAQEWPINFWNSEMDNLGNDMAQIRNDGFNSIILVIPWREFQPDVNPIRYNDNAIMMLDKVMRAADREGLKVYARIGYTWDYYNDKNENIADRFFGLLYDAQVKNAWFDYVSKMYNELSKYDNFAEGFLTWEDFWNNLGICDDLDENKRIYLAHQIGYGEYIKQVYSLEEYNNRYGTEYSSYDQIAVPYRNEPAMYAMFEYYDNFLMTILNESQKVFPNLSMEVRLDWDVTYNKQGELEYYKHTDTFLCEDSDFTATMYGIPMGFENVGEKVTYSEACEKTESILKNLKAENGNKAVYIDQFIFADNTPVFSYNARIYDDELDDYLLSISNILLENSDGYGVWTYRNYRNNMIYNSQFALGNEGWDGLNSDYYEVSDSMICRISPKGSLRQNIPNIRNHFATDKYIFEFNVVQVNKPGKVKIQIGNNIVEQIIDETKEIHVAVNQPEYFDLCISSIDADISIDNLRLYSHIQQGYLYDEDFKELECIDAIRTLNRSLQMR